LSIIKRIRRKVRERHYEFTVPHFLEEMADDDLQLLDIESAVLRGQIRRRFSGDPRGVRYEVVGPATDGRRIAVICRIKETGRVLLITTYVVD
jgi:ribosomal protein L21E